MVDYIQIEYVATDSSVLCWNDPFLNVIILCITSILLRFWKLYYFTMLNCSMVSAVNNAYIVGEKGASNCYLKASSCGKSSFTVLFCLSAGGQCLPPFVVYKGLHLYSNWTEGGPVGGAYGVSD